ncbi:hypothetical protein Fmac_032124 [Flemingia macrophylla]|uniref:Uncharacterized protein n=1 Tax=Flemingia macrophylla TaxID=520843 RepID=A0ABD1L4H0_9FABA
MMEPLQTRKRLLSLENAGSPSSVKVGRRRSSSPSCRQPSRKARAALLLSFSSSPSRKEEDDPTEGVRQRQWRTERGSGTAEEEEVLEDRLLEEANEDNSLNVGLEKENESIEVSSAIRDEDLEIEEFQLESNDDIGSTSEDVTPNMFDFDGIDFNEYYND